MYFEMLRHIFENKITAIGDAYMSLNLAIVIISKQFYKGNSGLQDKISHLVNIITKFKVLAYSYYKINSISQAIFVFNRDIPPRECGIDSV